MDDTFILTIAGDGSLSSDDLHELGLLLRDDLLDLEGASVSEATEGEAPLGTRADLVTVGGTLFVTMLSSRFAYRAVTDVVQAFVNRHKGNLVEMTLPDGTHKKIVGYSGKDASRLALDRHDENGVTDLSGHEPTASASASADAD